MIPYVFSVAGLCGATHGAVSVASLADDEDSAANNCVAS
jgi:hypothetical protein